MLDIKEAEEELKRVKSGKLKAKNVEDLINVLLKFRTQIKLLNYKDSEYLHFHC